MNLEIHKRNYKDEPEVVSIDGFNFERRETMLALTQLLAEARAENERLRGVLEEAKKITDLYFAPWGAAKGAEWEFLSGDIPFTPENALRLIQRALSTEPARRG